MLRAMEEKMTLKKDALISCSRIVADFFICGYDS